MMSGNSTFLSVTELIVRQAVSRDVAVMFLVETMGSHSAGSVYEAVCSHYSVPVLSYRKAVRREVKYAEKLQKHDPNLHYKNTMFSIFWTKYHAMPHPGWYVCVCTCVCVHVCMCVCMIY